ncbi:MAG: endonuclease/exonuclease/phosphatase family protein [Parachlamydiales bacterium]|nr:endonuclease/exonuclease/phosphatase family protein [Parachlamydiales bacterium]
MALFLYSSARFCTQAHWNLTDNWIKAISFSKSPETPLIKKCFCVTSAIFSSLVFAPFAISGLIIGQICHFTAFLLSRTPYIHLKGKTEAQTTDHPTILQLNCCLTGGGFALIFGGLPLPNDQRVAKISTLIQEKHPDIVCLQEVSDLNDALALYRNLSSEYTDFYLNIGATPFILQNNSGLFVASKLPLDHTEFHSFSDIKGTEMMVNKGYFEFSTPYAHFINTHLSPSADDHHPTQREIETRAKEQTRILAVVQQCLTRNQHPTYVLGDLNIHAQNDEYQQSTLIHQGIDHYTPLEIHASEATAETQFLIDHNWNHKKTSTRDSLIIDYFLSFFTPDSTEITTRKINTFDVLNPQEAVSDHAILYTEITSNT